MMLSSLLVAAAVSATTPPAPGALAFGSSPAAVRAVLGKPVAEEHPDDFTWRTYALGRDVVRVAYYHELVSQFLFVPTLPITQAQGRGWAKAFFPGLDKARVVGQEYFGTFIMQGRPFEAQLRLELHEKDVSSVGGEIHWMD